MFQKRFWLVVSTHLKNISQIWYPQIGVNIKNLWNHHPGFLHSSKMATATCDKESCGLVDVGFVNQNSGFINQRFDNQGSTTKNGGFVNQGSSTKKSDSSTKRFVNQKSWIRQPKTADSSTKVRQPRFVNQKHGFVNQGFVNQKVGFVNQKRRIHQPRFVNEKHGFVNQGFVNQKVGLVQKRRIRRFRNIFSMFGGRKVVVNLSLLCFCQITTPLQQLRFHNQSAGFNNHSRDGFKNHSFNNQQNGNRNAINPPPAPPHPWFLNSTLLVVEPLVVEDCGCWIRGFGCWIRLCWLLKPWLLNRLVVETGFFGCWSHGCWIRLFWLLNPALLVAEALVVEFFGCWFRLCWLLKLWLLNPSLWLLIPAFWLLNLSCWIRVGCWIRFCSCGFKSDPRWLAQAPEIPSGKKTNETYQSSLVKHLDSTTKISSYSFSDISCCIYKYNHMYGYVQLNKYHIYI